MPPPGLARRLTAEAVGTGFLVAAVVGSGIAAQRLSPNDLGLQLLENSFATAAALIALILAFGSLSGAHFNPVVTLADRMLGGMASGEAGAYVAAQVVGGCSGAIVANLMSDLPAIEWSTHERAAGRLWFGEAVATFGLVLVILGVVHNAGRSQIALGWFNQLAEGRAIAWSGGSEPAGEVNPAAIAAMAEVGIDITGEYPKPWTDEVVRAADVAVTMGCGDACPIFRACRAAFGVKSSSGGPTIPLLRALPQVVRAGCPASSFRRWIAFAAVDSPWPASPWPGTLSKLSLRSRQGWQPVPSPS